MRAAAERLSFCRHCFDAPAFHLSPAKNILIGGVDIPSQLIELGLVDEYRFVVEPIVAGEGRRLLEGVSLREIRLVESKIFKSGCVALRYLK
jgi:dihydrofolate reductase